ncbi:hypothetical protein GX50_07524 [[Emmonsia] crescens]|uniref:C2H2-type domain-containing protein n=1 Tax=[Emmonsia] crescens TaxID=73230 RepID=A0A2B7Z8F3_9EURO|nr:hypothetical protein GX50_07524 [Emmonsia crescens]
MGGDNLLICSPALLGFSLFNKLWGVCRGRYQQHCVLTVALRRGKEIDRRRACGLSCGLDREACAPRYYRKEEPGLCNSVFSRPYDLTRHEDTIHNARKQKVRCHLSNKERTFSRNDALTRHMRVVHPEVDWPGKQKQKD